MTEFDTNPIEELGFAKNAIVRVIEANRDTLPSDELKRLKLAYHGLDAVQQWFYKN